MKHPDWSLAPPFVRRNAVALGAWAVPSAVLALLPKCPACFAAWAALWTGIGLSMPVASGLHMTLIGVCFAMLIFLARRPVRRVVLWWWRVPKHYLGPCCKERPSRMGSDSGIAGAPGKDRFS
jgi:hypothetical protein